MEKPEIFRKRLLSILHNSEIMSFAIARLYSCRKSNTENWMDSNLEGILCYIIDNTQKTIFLALFDESTLELLFKHEIYKNFNKHYQVIQKNFHCFESNNCLIGIKFKSELEGYLFSLIVFKVNEEFTKILFSNHETRLRSPIKTRSKENDYLKCLLKLREKFFSKGSTKNYIFQGLDDYDDVLTIMQPQFFNLINDFVFDRSSRSFLIKENTVELRKMLSRLNINLNDMSNKTSTLKILREIITSLEEETQKKGNHLNANYFDLTQILRTKEMNCCCSAVYRDDEQVENFSENNKKFVPINEFIGHYAKHKSIILKNQNLPLHKKILYRFPKIPKILNGNYEQIMEFKTNELDQQIQNFKLKTLIKQIDDSQMQDKEYEKNCFERRKFNKSRTVIIPNKYPISVDFNKINTLSKRYETEESDNDWSD